MPGIYINFQKGLKSDFQFNRHHREDYQIKKIYSDSLIDILSDSYKNYPIFEYEDQKYFIVIEGFIYNYSVQYIIKELISFLNQKNNEKLNSDFLENLDGDFMIYLYNKNGKKLTIINDLSNRLPLYYLYSNREFICGRDLTVIKNYKNENEIDKDAMLDYLMFMHPLKDRTLYSGISKNEPAQILSFDFKNGFQLEKYFEWNFEHKGKYESFEIIEKKIRRIFVQGMQNRLKKTEGNDIGVLLSGGLDSRTIAALLKKADKEFNSFTFLSRDKSNLDDFQKSETISNLSNAKWNGFQLQNLEESSIQELLAIKSGMNYLGVAEMIPFLQAVSNDIDFGFTGDWGRIFKYDFPREKLSSYENLVRYFLKYKSVFSVSEIATILNISEKEILDRLGSMFKSYPEEKFSDKYLHYLYKERTIIWLQEGEDRNREYFWSMSPFSNQQLLKEIQKINPKYKKSFKLYKQIISNIDEEFLKIGYGETRNRITVKSEMIDRIKIFLGQFPQLKRLLKSLRTNLEQKEFAYPFDLASSKILNLPNKKLSKSKYYTLLTLSKVIDEIRN